MAKTISLVFSESQDRLCVWHIYQNVAKNLIHVFNKSNHFTYDLSNCVYDYEDENEWLLAWNSMLEKYSLEENKWLKELFEIRKKWVIVYGQHTFTADIKTTQCNESLNNMLKNYLKSSHNLLCLFEHYERVLNDRQYEELLADFNMMRSMPVLLTSVEMLRHGVEIYTLNFFELFQKEYTRLGDYNVYKVAKDGTKVEYKVSCAGKSQRYVVNFKASTETVMCSCLKFTFIGILYVHTLKVLDEKNIKRIPPQYIMKRWTRDAKARTITNYHEIEANDNPKVSIRKRYSHLCRNFCEISSLASEHKKLYAYANDRALKLIFSSWNSQEQQTRHDMFTQESQIGLGVETSSAAHSMMNYDHENFEAITNRQPNMFYIRLLQELHYGNLSQTAREGNQFENFPPF
ncbi:protein FAR1-RELATED SEQUENCE 5-like [Cornus florida]|uniref:protein FAR1-RELATED SEQUENCE 5-like n=1 Tax=Cornus florida TaxID=4283 RepID=UPI0028976404|nr:protein FAR1-RELATED SEQUENCE 5-like [Cornus florida]